MRVETEYREFVQVQAVSGEWMNSLVRQPSRRRNSKDYVAAGDIVARGIRRSWTISSPPSSKELPPSAQLQAYKTLEAPPRKFRDSGRIPDENQPPMDWQQQQQRGDPRFHASAGRNDGQAKGHQRVAPRRSASLSQADAAFFDDNVLPTCKYNAASSTRLFYEDHQRNDRKQHVHSGYDEEPLRGISRAQGLEAEAEAVWKSRWRSSSPPPVLEDWVPIKPPHLAWAKAVPVETTDDSKQIPRRRPVEPQSRRAQLKDDCIPRSVSGEMIYLERDPDAPYVRQRTLSIDRGTGEPMPYKTYEEELRDYKIRTGSVDRLALRGRQGRGIRMGTRSQVGRSVPTSLERRGSEPSREAYHRRRESDSSSSSNNRTVQRRSSSAATDFSNSSSGAGSAEPSRASRADEPARNRQPGRNVNRVYIDAPDDRNEANQIKVTMIDSHSLQRPAKNANNSCGSSTIPRTGKRSSSRENFGSTTVYLEATGPPCPAPEERQPSASTTTRDTAVGTSGLKMESSIRNKDYDIESLTGAIFHKVTVKRRKQESSHLDGRRLGEQPQSVNSPLVTRRTTHSLQEWHSYVVRTVQTSNDAETSDNLLVDEYSDMQDAAVQTSGLTSEDEASDYTYQDSNTGTQSAREESPLLQAEDRRSLMASSETCSALPCNSDTASDIVLDANKIVPEGDDYKLVFISSDSSKSSLEESFEASDQSPVHSRNPSSVNESDTGGFIDESDWDLFSSGLKKIAEQSSSSSGSKTRGKTRHNSSSDESKVHQPSKNINRKGTGSKQRFSENDCSKSSTLGSMTSSDNNSPRTFLIDDFNYAWDHSHEHLAKSHPAAATSASSPDHRQRNESQWSIASAAEDEKPDPVTYTTREVQTDADMSLLYDTDGLEMVDTRTSASPTRSMEEWETMSHIRASRVSTPACLSRNFSLLDESNKSYVPIWQISTSSRSSNQSLHNLLSTCIETQTETQSLVDVDQSVARRSHLKENSFLISAAKLDDSYAYFVEPPGGGSFTDSPSADYVRSSQDYRQSVPNRYFSRSDSKRSSGERSLEEFSFRDHIFAHDNVISSLYSPDGLALPGFQEYRDKILTEIQAYTAKGDWNLVASESTALMVPKNDNYLVNSSPYQSEKKAWHDLNAVKKSAISRAKLGNYCVWPTGSRLVPNSVKRWRGDETDKPRPPDFHAFNRQTAAAGGSAVALLSSGVSVESCDNKHENQWQNSTIAEKSSNSEVPEAILDISPHRWSHCESPQHSNRDWNFSLFANNGAPASTQSRPLDMSSENKDGDDESAVLKGERPQTLDIVESQDHKKKGDRRRKEFDEENPREPSGSNHLLSENEYAGGVSDFSWSEAREKPSNLGLDPEAPSSLVSPTSVDSGLKESVADLEEHLAGESPRVAQPIHLFLALSRQGSLTGEQETEGGETAQNPCSPRQDNKTSQSELSHAQLSQPGSENPHLKGQLPNERDPGSAQLQACAMETHAISTSPHNGVHENSHSVEREGGETEQNAHSQETGSGESATSLEPAAESLSDSHDSALAKDTLSSDDSVSRVNNTDLVRLGDTPTVEALNSNVTLPEQHRQPLAPVADESTGEMTVRAAVSQQEDSSNQSRFQVSTIEPKPNHRLLSDSDVTTSGDEGESPSFDTDSQQDTVIEGHSQAFQDLRQFALKHSLALARKDSSLSPTPPSLFDVSDAHQSDTDSSSSRCSLRPSSFPASPVPSDGRLTPRRAQGQYTSYVLITQEESESQKAEKVISDDESRVTVTVPQPSSSDKSAVCVVEVPAKPNWMESHDENTDSESQDITEDSASCVTVSGNGVLTDHDIEEETSADEDTLTDHVENSSNLAKYFTLALETGFSARRKQPVVYRNPERTRSSSPDPFSEDLEEKADSSIDQPNLSLESTEAPHYESDLSEKIDSIDETESNYSESASSGDEAYFDREEELRGYNRAIDFTLHTILEESCEESDSERRSRTDSHNPQTNPSELEKYFTFDLGGGVGSDPAENKRRTSFANEESEYSDTFSETSSSIYSEGLEARSGEEEDIDPVELASSRLEKYFMTGFLGLEQGQYSYGAAGLTGAGSDGSESVGSDSEGHPSPEQRRRKVVRARGSRQQASPHSGYRSSERKETSSSEVSHASASENTEETSADKKDGSLSSSEVSDFSSSEAEDIVFEKNDGQFDTIKRRKKKRSAGDHDIERTEKKSAEEPAVLPEPEAPKEETRPNEELPVTADGNPEDILDPDSPRKYQSRDSGFVGSCDDLLNDSTPSASAKEIRKRVSSESGSSSDSEVKNSANSAMDDLNRAKNDENDGGDTKSGKSVGSSGSSGEAAGSLTSTSQSSRSGKLSRKDSFNNWSSDEETNLMMSKMKAFFRNMVSGGGGLKCEENGQRVKPPQLLAFENELTRLMKTVPGINDEQVKEIVEYLSSEDTWSDSYDSSDYTSSDLEGAYAVLDPTLPELDVKSDLQQQISASCQEIIAKFELNRSPVGSNPSVDVLGVAPWMPAGEDPSNSLNKETAFVYQRLVNSLMRLNNGPKVAPEVTESAAEAKTPTQSPHNSPPMIAKVLQHIGNKLVALMHEVSASSDTTSHSGSIDEDAQSAGRMKEIRLGFEPVTSSPRLSKLPRHFLHKDRDRSSNDDSNSLNSTSIDSEGSPTDTEQSPDSDDHAQPNRESAVLKYGYENVHYEKRMSSLPSQFGSEGKNREEQRGFSSLESAESRGIIGGSRSLKARLAERARTLESERRRAEEKRSGSASALAEEDTAEDDEDRYVKKERKLPRFSLFRTSRDLQSSSSGVSDIAEEKEDEFSGWRSSFESAIAADSRTKLSLEAKRRSAGSASSSELFASNDHLLDREARRVRSSGHSSKFSLPNLLERDAVRSAKERERERERSASSDVLLSTSPIASNTMLSVIDQQEDEDTDWDRLVLTRLSSKRRSSVPDTREERAGEKSEPRSTTLPRSTTALHAVEAEIDLNSSPSISASTAGVKKSLSMLLNSSANSASESSLNTSADAPIRSARYRPPGFRPQPPATTRTTPRAPSASGLQVNTTPRWSTAPLSHRRNVRSMLADDRSDSTSSPSFVREGLRTSVASAASGESFSSVSAADTNDENELSVSASKPRSSSLSALGIRSDSMASVYSAAGEVRYGTVAVRGEVQFGLHYNYRQAALEVLVKQCRDLAPVDVKRNRSDPYVKVYLLPDRSKSGKRKTKVKKHTLCPIFDELLRFQTTLADLEHRTLWLTVWHSDMFGRNDFLGEVTLPLAGKIFDDPTPHWYQLQEQGESLETFSASSPVHRGDIIVALKYVPADGSSKKSKKTKGSLHVMVKEAKGLVTTRHNGNIDSLCKGTLLPDKGKTGKHKTGICRRTSNPVWNNTLIFDDVSQQELAERALELVVWNHDRLGAKEFLGGVRFSLGGGMYQGRAVDWLDSTDKELTLWQSVLDRANLWCEGSIALRTIAE